MKPRLTIVPISGLGNRMRVVASMVEASASLDVPVRIVWQSTWDCRALFSDLFCPLSDADRPANDCAEEHTEQGITIDAGNFCDAPAVKQNLWLPYLIRRFRYGKEIRIFHPQGEPDIFRMVRQWPSLYVVTCYAMTGYRASTMQRCFRPLPALHAQIDEVTARFTSRTVGVHVRRTDNRQAITHSPLSAFRHRLDRLLDSGEADTIFLSTDDARVRTYFRETYGSRLITRPIKVRRDTLEGIRDAVVDLWSLSKARLILGSYYSSFSDTAHELSGAPLEIITTDPTSSNTISS